MPANRGPNLPQIDPDARAASSQQRACCATCAGELRFTTDALGFTIEHCDGCRSSRRIVAQRATRETTRKRGEVTALVLAVVPRSPDDALPLDAITALAGIAKNRVSAVLCLQKEKGVVRTVRSARAKTRGRPVVWRYWRAA